MAKSFDVIIVGAGPAGSMAALKLARAGASVCLLERGKQPGSKNMFGGLVHNCPVLNETFPDFWETAPVERHVYKKVLAFMTPESAVSLTFDNENFDRPPYNGVTVFRPVFDAWLAQQANKAGALLLCECTADDVIRKDGRINGVTVKGREGEIRGNIIIAADGALSFTAQKAGLRPKLQPGDMGVGIKLLLGLPEETINERFHLVRDQGADVSFLGAAGDIRGGGFLYTNHASVSIGLVMHLESLKLSEKSPYDVLNDFLQYPQVSRLIKGAVPLEYSAHLIPEGGYKAIPPLYTDGLLVAGDAAGLCYTNGINVEGINLALTSGALAAETAMEALKSKDYSAKSLSSYKKKLDASFVLKDMKNFKHSPGMMGMDRLYKVYPQIIAGIMENLYKTEGKPRPKLLKLIRREALEKVGLTKLLADGFKIGRSLL